MLTRFPPLKEGITLVCRVGPKKQDCKGHAGVLSLDRVGNRRQNDLQMVFGQAVNGALRRPLAESRLLTGSFASPQVARLLPLCPSWCSMDPTALSSAASEGTIFRHWPLESLSFSKAKGGRLRLRAGEGSAPRLP